MAGASSTPHAVQQEISIDFLSASPKVLATTLLPCSYMEVVILSERSSMVYHESGLDFIVFLPNLSTWVLHRA